MTRYSGTCTLLAGVSCCVLGGAACGGLSNAGDPPTVSDDESALIAQVLGNAGPALTVADSDDGGRRSSLPIPPGNDVPRPHGRPGNLRVLDWAGFHGAVTYTFDDSQPSQIEHYAELQAAGVPMTFYLSSGWENTSPNYVATWQQVVRDGHEIGNHTVHHCNADLTGCAAPGTPLATPLAEIDVNATYIADHTAQPLTLTMASPFGDANWDVFAQQRVFLNRDVFQGFVAPNDNTDPFHLPTMMAGATDFGGIDDKQSTFEGLIDTARSTDQWLNFLFHTILPTTNNWFGPVDIGAITGSMQHAKSLRDVWIDTMLEIGAYWRAQKLITGLTPIQIGRITIWAWQLPDHFPRGKFVRVRVDGGTLIQQRGPLPWNRHGFFEVSLDDRVLVLVP